MYIQHHPLPCPSWNSSQMITFRSGVAGLFFPWTLKKALANVGATLKIRHPHMHARVSECFKITPLRYFDQFAQHLF